jgi:RNA polymerase sigma-B factor
MVERCRRHRDPADLDALVRRFAPLAEAMVGRFRDSGEPADDLLQVARMGLLKAVERFDAGRGVAFTSYAVPTMQGELKRHFRDRCWSVRPPRDLLERSLRVERAVDELTVRLRRRPTVAEIASHVALDAEDVLEALEAARAHHAMSLDAPRRGAGEDNVPETLADGLGHSEDGFEAAEQRAWLAQLGRCLSPREREVLRLRFEEDLTQAQIGARVGVSQMQVSRILRDTLACLRAGAA